ncbi:hypothetical protein EV384_6748 [Micromonospora kangleipakensis]|uniref:ThiF family protein n=1 Tax=Micromonospora kangleipakensis TaxID=1077942 RepID=A0A4Q8BIU3_9ACTN|nr:hypothetical protein EV384_6748 [Micromonospora kangleipakensis]
MATPPPFHVPGRSDCRLADSPTGRLWKTGVFLWTALGRARRTCGQRSTEGTDAVTIRVMSRATPLTRPTLLPGLTRLWRDRHTLQLGVEPGRAVLLEVTNPRAARLLDLLDGTRSERSVLDCAATADVPSDEARALLDTLHAAGLVVPAHTLLPRDLAGPVRARLAAEAGALALAAPGLPGTPARLLRRRRAARVLVTGAGRLGGPLAVALAQAGVGHLDPDLAGPVRPADLVGTGLAAAEVGQPLAAAASSGGPRRARRPGRSDAAGSIWSSSSAWTGRPPCSPPGTPSAASPTCWSACAAACRWSARWSDHRSGPA